ARADLDRADVERQHRRLAHHLDAAAGADQDGLALVAHPRRQGRRAERHLRAAIGAGDLLHRRSQRIRLSNSAFLASNSSWLIAPMVSSLCNFSTWANGSSSGVAGAAGAGAAGAAAGAGWARPPAIAWPIAAP